MSISNYIKKVGRGAKGAGDLLRMEAKDVLDKIFDEQVSDIELGAFCLAMRIKGESSGELAGFMDALEEGRLRKVSIASNQPVVVLPSYNGARKTPNWVPLLALLLAQEKIPVLIHGNEEDEKRTTSMEIFKALNVKIAASLDEMAQELENGAPVFVPLRVLSPELDRLLNVRQKIGLRNFGHVLAKLVNPIAGPSLPIFNYTHPVYPETMQNLFNIRPGNCIVMRGHEGEPVASPQRLPSMIHFQASCPENPQSTSEMQFTPPDLDLFIDAKSTAKNTRRMLAGEMSIPESIQAQVKHIRHMLENMKDVSKG